jgi:receptor protein-tyrosine kinase
LIENALKKLQGAADAAASRTPAPRGAGPPSPPGPAARQEKVSVQGPKHHVDQDALIRSGLLAASDRAANVAEQFRMIKRPLIVNAFAAQPRADRANVIMITSALPKAGKTFCAINLAVSISMERELNVLLVDADVAKPNASHEFGLADAPGLIDLLLDESPRISDVLVRTDLNDIQILPAGRAHAQATELLASERMSRLMQELATRYSDRIIIVDSPPLLVTTEAQALARQVGQIALVVEAGRTSHQELSQMLEAISEEKTIAVILNKSRGWIFEERGVYRTYGYETK